MVSQDHVVIITSITQIRGVWTRSRYRLGGLLFSIARWLSSNTGQEADPQDVNYVEGDTLWLSKLRRIRRVIDPVEGMKDEFYIYIFFFFAYDICVLLIQEPCPIATHSQPIIQKFRIILWNLYVFIPSVELFVISRRVYTVSKETVIDLGR